MSAYCGVCGSSSSGSGGTSGRGCYRCFGEKRELPVAKKRKMKTVQGFAFVNTTGRMVCNAAETKELLLKRMRQFNWDTSNCRIARVEVREIVRGK